MISEYNPVMSDRRLKSDWPPMPGPFLCRWFRCADVLNSSIGLTRVAWAKGSEAFRRQSGALFELLFQFLLAAVLIRGARSIRRWNGEGVSARLALRELDG
jgi:hypothetical protein